MKKTWKNVEQKMYELQLVIEDAMAVFPDGSPKNWKMKKKLESAWRDVGRAMDQHDNMVNDVVPPIQMDMDGYAQEFIEIWNEYKDYMLEQQGVRMGSRMQMKRLNQILEFANNDIKLASKFINYYMAAGSIGIYKVKLEETEQATENGQSKQETKLSIPKRFKKSGESNKTTRETSTTSS
jgi:hypothetical protein